MTGELTAAARAKLEAAVDLAVAKGTARREIEALRTAFHESGHVVMAMACGSPVLSVVEFAGDGGVCRFDPDYGLFAENGSALQIQYGKNRIAISRAGEAAVALAGLPNPEGGAQSDRERALSEARQYGFANPERASRDALAAAKATLSDRWPELVRFTAYLRASDGRLAGDEVTAAWSFARDEPPQYTPRGPIWPSGRAFRASRREWFESLAEHVTDLDHDMRRELWVTAGAMAHMGYQAPSPKWLTESRPSAAESEVTA